MVDALVAFACLLALVGGWRLGGVASFLSAVGVIAGLVVGAGIMPLAMSRVDAAGLRFLVAVGVLLLLVAVGNLVGGLLGASVRRALRARSSVRADSALGALFQVAVTLVVVWLVSIPAATSVGGQLAAGIRNSRILGAVDRAMPDSAAQWPAKISALLSDTGMPPLISPFGQGPAPEVAAPRIEVEDAALVERLRPSVIHVMGEAPECRRRLMGSGFVAAEDYVITNAHVVAGTQRVRLDTALGVRDADVVFYDPEVDIAVLYSPGLGIAPLAWADYTAQTGQDAIVMGFPESGPFEAAPARVREALTIAGPDIYASGRVEREAYTLRGSVREGNSGGPLFDDAGRVLGVIFGASVDQTDTGYALTGAEVRDRVGNVTALRQPVDTGGCVAR
ncbi:MarP family serine protease [Corynebacterium sp. zg-331]|uniref:MarP family serine protease n=1 Tax=unclassified Corynebacterium TaxID=2624378 RepID=UPI00128E950F|nr:MULTISPECIES: MarP family serine protease [unclassified Corynebacterium]MBC3186567.1 MarP family serine protease [Corynebacterium sp. zg-331]MPV53051.1 MarP family serine protease [Corynebacterium sp. zg331]